MATLSLSTHIAAPRDRVFEAFSDVGRWADHVAGIVRVARVTEGPIGNGTRFRETRIMFKKEHTEEMEFAEFDPPTGYAVMAESCGSSFVTRFTFTDADGGTQVDMQTSTKALTFFAKLMAPLGALMMGPMKKLMAKDMRDFKRVIEAGEDGA